MLVSEFFNLNVQSFCFHLSHEVFSSVHLLPHSFLPSLSVQLESPRVSIPNMSNQLWYFSQAPVLNAQTVCWTSPTGKLFTTEIPCTQTQIYLLSWNLLLIIFLFLSTTDTGFIAVWLLPPLSPNSNQLLNSVRTLQQYPPPDLSPYCHYLCPGPHHLHVIIKMMMVTTNTI